MGLGTVELGQRGRLGELAPQLRRPGGRSGDQPPLGASTDPKERLLVRRARPRLALDRSRRPRRVVLVADARPARRGQCMPGDLARPVRAVGVDDDELGSVDSRPQTRSSTGSLETE
jgi:hypothetical protein